jgi:hypothetical protein
VPDKVAAYLRVSDPDKETRTLREVAGAIARMMGQ